MGYRNFSSGKYDSDLHMFHLIRSHHFPNKFVNGYIGLISTAYLCNLIKGL